MCVKLIFVSQSIGFYEHVYSPDMNNFNSENYSVTWLKCPSNHCSTHRLTERLIKTHKIFSVFHTTESHLHFISQLLSFTALFVLRLVLNLGFNLNGFHPHWFSSFSSVVVWQRWAMLSRLSLYSYWDKVTEFIFSFSLIIVYIQRIWKLLNGSFEISGLAPRDFCSS